MRLRDEDANFPQGAKSTPKSLRDKYIKEASDSEWDYKLISVGLTQ
jgi:hypothetical protein